MRVEADDFYTGWRRLLEQVLDFGYTVRPRGLEIKELIGTQLHIANLRNNIVFHEHRDANYRFMLAEWLWMLAGRGDVATVARYNKQIARFSDDGQTFAGAYGPRLLPQWDYVLDTLRADPDSRQAIASIWTPSPARSLDIPCTLSAQFFIRDRQLHSIWTMRSNDLWLGLTYDFFNFSQLTNGLAAELKVQPGSLTLNCGSSHIYATNYDAVEQVLSNHRLGGCLRSPALWRQPKAEEMFAAVDGLWTKIDLNRQELEYVRALRSKTKVEAFAILQQM